MAYIELPNNENVYSIPLWEQSDAMVVSGSFLRCRNIGLSWQMKREWCEKNIYEKSITQLLTWITSLLSPANVSTVSTRKLATVYFHGIIH